MLVRVFFQCCESVYKHTIRLSFRNRSKGAKRLFFIKRGGEKAVRS